VVPDLSTIWCGDVGGTRVTLLGTAPHAQSGVIVLEWLARDMDADMYVRAAWTVSNGEVWLSSAPNDRAALEGSTGVVSSMASMPRLKAIRQAAAIALRLAAIGKGVQAASGSTSSQD
jgi:hypothetical protein